jgi:hypothetical protein
MSLYRNLRSSLLADCQVVLRRAIHRSDDKLVEEKVQRPSV